MITRQDEAYESDPSVYWEYQYDAAKRLEHAYKKQASDNSIITQYHYQYDDSGNRTQKSVDGVVTDYDYNSLGQLYQATTGGVVTTYQYDAYGNQTAQLKDGVLEYAYSWSISNEMTSAKIYDTDGTTVVKTIAFGYDEKGTRVSRQETGGDPTRYLTDHRNPTGYSQTLAELDESATQLQGNGYVYGDSLIVQSDVGDSYFFHGDHLGSTRLLTGTDGSSIINSGFIYSPYGLPLQGDGSLTNYYYTGQYREAFSETHSLQYHRARWLNMALGTWLSVDTVFDFPNNFGSQYGYVGMHPTIAVDRSGEFLTIAGAVFVSGLVAFLAITAALIFKTVALTYIATIASLVFIATLLVMAYMWFTLDETGKDYGEKKRRVTRRQVSRNALRQQLWLLARQQMNSSGTSLDSSNKLKDIMNIVNLEKRYETLGVLIDLHPDPEVRSSVRGGIEEAIDAVANYQTRHIELGDIGLTYDDPMSKEAEETLNRLNAEGLLSDEDLEMYNDAQSVSYHIFERIDSKIEDIVKDLLPVTDEEREFM